MILNNSQQRQTSFDQSVLDPSQNTSRDALSSFEQLLLSGNMQQTPVAELDDVVLCTEDEKLAEDETSAKIRQYKVWAVELRHELEKGNYYN